MSLLGSFLRRIFGWSSSKNDYYDPLITKSGIETLDGTDDDDKYTISAGWRSPALKSQGSGSNVIEMGAGDDTLTISGRIESTVSNEINLGSGDNVLKTTSYMLATEGGENIITGGDGDNRLSFTGNLQAEDDSYNSIALGDGDNTISIGFGLSAQDEGVNDIQTGSGDDCVTITRGMYAEGENKVDLGDGDNTITVYGGMNADGGTNSITTGDGDDLVSIWGSVKADEGMNVISTGDGDDTISIHNFVESGALEIDAGDGDNTLLLNGSRVSLFNDAYEEWLTDYDGLASSGISTIEVALTRTAGLEKLEWLSDVAENAGIDLQLNVDHMGRNLKLSSFFTDDEADVFSVISMEGGVKNTLTISGDSLADSGYNGDELTILGDSKDVVKISDSWEEVSSNDNGFQVFSNDEGQSLLIQHDISVLFM